MSRRLHDGLRSHLVTAVQVGWVFFATAVLVAVFAPLTMRQYHDGLKENRRRALM